MNLLNLTLTEYIEESFKKHENNTAIIYPEKNETYTYLEFQNKINCYSIALMKLGVKKTSHIGVFSDNTPEYLALLLASMKIGAVLVSINNNYTEKELSYVLKQSDCSLLFTTNELMNKVIKNSNLDLPNLNNILTFNDLSKTYESIENKSSYILELKEAQKTVLPDDTALILYTSGTTGLPKSVLHSHCCILNGIRSFQKQFNYDEDDKLILVLPLYHMMGCLYSSLLMFFVGGSLVVINKFKTSTVLKTIESERCTCFHGVPTMFRFLLNKYKDYNISSLKKGFIAGSDCPSKLLEDIREKLGIDSLYCGYGQTESLGITLISITNTIESITYTTANPVDNVSIKIRDINSSNTVPAGENGEIIVLSPYLMQGYYNNDEANKKAIDEKGWLHTGDIGIMNKDGSISIVGRLKDIINRGGENISPVEIENEILKLEKVSDVAIVGVPDSLMGEEICAFIIPKENISIELEELKTLLSKNLSRYKMPKYLFTENSFPVNPSGKVQKYLLQQKAIDRLALAVTNS